MLDLTNLQKGLEDFGQNVVTDAKANLVAKKKVASGKLLNSIKVNNLKVRPKSMELSINMTKYGAFIDQGVSGVKVKYNTPYSYTNKMPPPSAFDSWIVKKGIAPRTKTGQFLTRKSIQWAIAVSVFNNGIKPTKFLTDAVKKNFKVLPDMIKDKFALDVENTVKLLIKTNFQNLKK